MKQQSVGIVLCALLFTTFGHDVLNRLHVAHSARLISHGHGHSKHKQARDGLSSTPSKCYCQCTPTTSTSTSSSITPSTPTTTTTTSPFPGGPPTTTTSPSPGGPTTTPAPLINGGLTIAINVTANLLGVYNESANVALVLDVKAGLVGVFNLSSTGGFIVNIKSQSVVQVSGIWQANVSFAVAFGVLASSGLQAVYSQGQVVASAQYAVFFQFALVVLSYGDYNVNASQSLGFLLSVSGSLVVSFKSVWSIIASGQFGASIGLKKLLELSGGFSIVIANIQGGVVVIEKYNIVFDLQIIFSASSSFQITGYIWQQLNATDIQNIFGDLSNSTNLLRVIAGLGGNSTVGVNGLVTVLLQVVLIANGQGSLDTLITVLIQYFSSSNTSVAVEWDAAVGGLYNLTVKLNLTEKLQGAVALLLKIQQGAWIEAGINISAIVSALVKFETNARLTALAAVLILLKAQISIDLAIATLILHFIELLLVAGGIQILVIITGIEVGAQFLSAGAGALLAILKGISITRIIALGFGGLASFIAGLPVLGGVVTAINAAFQGSGSVQASFSFHISFQIFVKIQGIFLSALKGSILHLPIPLLGGPVIEAAVVGNSTGNASSNASSSSSSDYNISVGGGTGGKGGDGGDSSGNSSSLGNAGNVNGGGGSGNHVSVGGNDGGNVSQSGGGGGNGGAGTGGTYEVSNRHHKAKGKHAKSHNH